MSVLSLNDFCPTASSRAGLPLYRELTLLSIGPLGVGSRAYPDFRHYHRPARRSRRPNGVTTLSDGPGAGRRIPALGSLTRILEIL